MLTLPTPVDCAAEQPSAVASKVTEIAKGTVPTATGVTGVTPSQAVATLPPSSKFAEFLGTLGKSVRP